MSLDKGSDMFGRIRVRICLVRLGFGDRRSYRLHTFISSYLFLHLSGIDNLSILQRAK